MHSLGVRSAPRVYAVLSCIPVLVIALTLSPDEALASTLTYDVTGGGGLDVGYICLTSASSCSGSPTFTLNGAAPVTGSLVFNTTTDTASFSITLTSAATFGTETLAAGSTFSASGIPVLELGSGASAEIVQNGSASGTVMASFSGLSSVASDPVISGLTCNIGSSSKQCGVSFGPGGFELTDGTNTYYADLTFNAGIVPVPLPADAWLILSGLAGLGLLAGKRRTS